MLLLSERKFTI